MLRFGFILIIESCVNLLDLRKASETRPDVVVVAMTGECLPSKLYCLLLVGFYSPLELVIFEIAELRRSCGSVFVPIYS